MVHAGVLAHRAGPWVLLGAVVAGALLFTLLRAIVPSDGARVAFYGEAWSAAGVRIDPIDAPAAGLESGDVVVAIDDHTMEAWLTDIVAGRWPPPDSAAAIPYALVRDGTALETPVTWAPPSIWATLVAGWSVLLFSAASAGVAALVYARRPAEPAATALMIAAAGAAGSSLPWFLGTTTSDVVQGAPFVLHTALTGAVYMLLWPAGVHLALVFPTRGAHVERHRWLVPATYATVLGVYTLLLLAAAARSRTALEWVGTWPAIQVSVVAPTLLIAVVLVAVRYARTRDPAARARVRLATLGVVGSAVMGLVLFQLPELLLGGSLLPPEAIGLIALPLPLGFAAAILRDHLFDLDVAVNRTVVYGGLTLGVLAVYVAAVYALSLVAGDDPGYAGRLLATGVAALAALPLRDALQRAVNRAMYGSRDEPWRAVRLLGSRLEWAVDPELAFPAVAETVADALRLPYVGVEIPDDRGQPALVAEHGTRRGPTESVPLVHGGEPVGRLLLGVRAGERGFRPAELDLLRDLARQAGAAIHAQRLRSDLVRSRERLVVAREEERRRLRRDLHDGLGPTLAAIGMRADAAGALLGPEAAAARRQLDALGEEVRVALADVRRLVDGLRPPALDELGLLGAISQQAARLGGGPVEEDGPATIQVESDPVPMPVLPAAVEVAAYRITVEAMTNAVRHAGARRCHVRLEVDSQLVIEVIDDGLGMPGAWRPGTGIESMRERAGELGGAVAIEAGPGGGTRVIARLPLAGGSPA